MLLTNNDDHILFIDVQNDNSMQRDRPTLVCQTCNMLVEKDGVRCNNYSRIRIRPETHDTYALCQSCSLNYARVHYPLIADVYTAVIDVPTFALTCCFDVDNFRNNTVSYIGWRYPMPEGAFDLEIYFHKYERTTPHRVTYNLSIDPSIYLNRSTHSAYLTRLFHACHAQTIDPSLLRGSKLYDILEALQKNDKHNRDLLQYPYRGCAMGTHSCHSPHEFLTQIQASVTSAHQKLMTVLHNLNIVLC